MKTEKELTINIPKLYSKFCEENVSISQIWNWEEKKNAFGVYCYIYGFQKGRKQALEEMKNMIDKFQKYKMNWDDTNDWIITAEDWHDLKQQIEK